MAGFRELMKPDPIYFEFQNRRPYSLNWKTILQMIDRILDISLYELYN